MEYLYLQDGFYDGEDPREIQRFLDTVERGGYKPAKGKVELVNDTGVLIIELSIITDDLPC
jgi:hypothetical protein